MLATPLLLGHKLRNSHHVPTWTAKTRTVGITVACKTAFAAWKKKINKQKKKKSCSRLLVQYKFIPLKENAILNIFYLQNNLQAIEQFISHDIYRKSTEVAFITCGSTNHISSLRLCIAISWGLLWCCPWERAFRDDWFCSHKYPSLKGKFIWFPTRAPLFSPFPGPQRQSLTRIAALCQHFVWCFIWNKQTFEKGIKKKKANWTIITKSSKIWWQP